MKEIADPILGKLVWNDRLSALEGSLQLSSDRTIDLTIYLADEYAAPAQLDETVFTPRLARARLQVTSLARSEQELRLQVADSVIRDYCQEFHIEGVDRTEIAENITLYAVHLFPPAGMHLYYFVNDNLAWWQEQDITAVVNEQGEIGEVFWL